MARDTGTRGLSRREILALAGGAGLSVVAAPLLAGCSPSSSSQAGPSNGVLTAYRNAMHVHSSFSEGTGSLHSQLEEAAGNGFDVFWPTDHDWRMSAFGAPDTFHFTALTETVAGRRYAWTPVTSGALAAHSGGISSLRVSPTDPGPVKRSLRLDATSSGAASASHHFLLDGRAANLAHRTNLSGQTLVIDVLPELAGPDAWAEVVVTMSYRPAASGRPAGSYELVYRLGTTAAAHSSQGLQGIVTVPLPRGRFSTVTIDPTKDAASIWPDIVASDNALVDLRLGVTSQARVPARAWFGHLRFERTKTSGDLPLHTQGDMIDRYAPDYPLLAIRRGVEVSGPSEHANWFGGEQHLVQYATTSPSDLVAFAASTIHATGGLASLNHPFGTGEGAYLTQAAQDSQRRRVAASFLGRQLCGVDIVETGYRQRQGMSLESHLALLDTFLRSGYWVTATGVNDNHDGTTGSWSSEPNRFYSTTWAESRSEDDLLTALRSGRVFVGELGGFRGTLDLSVEGNPMGSVSVRPDTSRRELTMTATDLPPDARVEVVRGLVDHGTSTDPASTVVEVLSPDRFVGDVARVGIDTTTDCFVRINVVDGTGRRVAFSNPIGLLRSEPPRPLPAGRRAPDSSPAPSGRPSSSASPSSSTSATPSSGPSESGTPTPSQ